MAEVIKIDSNTWRFEDGFVRFFLLEGEDKSVLIDSGMNCPNAAEMAKRITDKPVMLLNTHGDMDHTSGTGGFSYIYMNPSDYSACGIKERYPETSLVEVTDGEIIELGNRTLQIIYVPGHTAGSIAVLDINNRILYAGDSVQKGHIYMFGTNRVPQQFEDSLDKLIGMQDMYDVIYASHDQYKMPGDYAQKVKKAWKQVQSGEVQYELTDMFGQQIKSYTTDVCGFYISDIDKAK